MTLIDKNKSFHFPLLVDNENILTKNILNIMTCANWQLANRVTGNWLLKCSRRFSLESASLFVVKGTAA